MHFSAGISLAVLSAVLTPAAAWEATLYTDSICLAKGNTQYRIISGSVDGGCNVLGKDMPGTSCDKFTNGGADKGACDGEKFQPSSILVQPDTACIVYADDHCGVGGELAYPKNNIPTCLGYTAGIGFGLSSIKSFACTASSNLKGSGIPGF
ncbi:unnamed protein product [Fusarium graminearum]|nr:unnamed protein product [Fusarium graminearum]